MKKALAIVAVAALALAAAFGIFKSVSGGSAGDRGKASIPSDESAVNNAQVVWGPIVRFSTSPLPSRRLVVTQNALILDSDLPPPGVVDSKKARVSCDIYYTRGWNKVVRKQTVAGTWVPPYIAEKLYGGQLTGQVRCGPFTVAKKSLGLWLGVNPRLTWERVTFERTNGKGVNGSIIRTQIRTGKPAPRLDPDGKEATSFLPSVQGGPIYPALGTVPFGGQLASIWQAFGRPPASTCSGSQCYWATDTDRLFLQLALPFNGAEQGERIVDRAVLSSKRPTASKLSGWETPQGIHIGSSRADVLKAYPGADCVGQRCNVTPALASLGGARYRFSLAIGLDDDAPDAVVESIDVTQIGSVEGTCRPTVTFREQGIPDSARIFHFVARCSGKLTSARLEPLDASTQLGEAETNERNRVDPSVFNAAGGAPLAALGHGPLSTVGLANGAYTWQIGCDVDGKCAPGRGSGTPAWDGALYEDWELVFRGVSTVPSRIERSQELIAPLRFVAEFADQPTFTYVLRQAF